MKPYLHAKCGVCVLQLLSLASDPKEEEKEEQEFGKITFMNITHILHQITSIFMGLIFMVIFTLILVDVELKRKVKIGISLCMVE